MASATETADNPAISRSKLRLATILLGISMGSTGASGLVNEYILATVATYILGNSIQQFSVIIALMLLMMGVAGWVQKFSSNRRMIEKFLGVETTIALLGGFAPIAIYAAFASMTDHFQLVLYAFVMAIGFLIGFEIPLVLRINKAYSERLRANLAVILSMDYIGSFIGAFIWSFFLLRTFPITEISFLVSGLNFLVAAITFLYFLRHHLVALKAIPIVAIALTISGLSYGYTHNRDWNAQLEQKFYDDPVIFSKTTPYQHLVMTHNSRLNEYRLYINGNTQFSSLDEAIYHEHLVHPVMSLVPEHQRVLILGGGDGLALREVLKYPDVRSVTLVDLDSDMVEIAATHPIFTKLNNNAFADARVHRYITRAIASDGVRPIFMETGQVNAKRQEITEKVATVQVVTVDADKFIREIDDYYNVIMVDLPDPASIELAKLYSKEFYLKLKGRLSENGMIVTQATSPYHAKESFLNIRRTMEATGLTTLPYHDNVPSFGDWGWILAWSSNRPLEDVKATLEHIDSFPVTTQYLTPELTRASLAFGKGMLTPAPQHEDKINTLMHPVLLHLYLEESWKVY
ncbi:MAG: polyamine aminopropyltransferase [Candidatus Bipolaricaulia bacterium]